MSNLPVHLLPSLIDKYGLKYFVETGTAGGHTTQIASTLFDKVWTCEIDPEMCRQAKERLVGYNNIEFSNAESPAFLEYLLLDQPVLYWLDAHWCGGPVLPDKECPLIEELAAIGSFFFHHGRPSVIMIDDINMMRNPPPPPHDPKQWPTMTDVADAFDAWNEPYTFELHKGKGSDVLIVTPKVTT